MSKKDMNIVGDPNWGPFVVVVDDEVLTCDALQQILSGMQCRSVSFQNANAALDSLAKISTVDLINH